MIEIDLDKGVYLQCYHHLLDESDNPDEFIDIEFIWGGRDSGKSQFVAQKLLEDSMALDYFRCILIKETHESIKDAQWQMIKDIAEDWGVDSLFKFNSSPLAITCINNNRFLTRGLNQPGRIRSISNPSHAWVEEGNQITEEGFITLLTSLRSNKGRVKLWFTFNPEAKTADFNDFWLYRVFFTKYAPLLNFIGTFVIKVPGKKDITLRYRSTHVTYHDNPYVTDQRKAFHESLKESNYYWYQVFTLGLWGNQPNENPWAFAFRREKHVGSCHLNRSEIVYLCFDFNRNPLCCSVIQHYNDTIYVLETIKLPKSGIDAMCSYILVNYPGCLYMVTGDYSGKAESSLQQEQLTHYKLIKHYLTLSDGQIKVIPNPRLHKNAVHVNSILAYYKVIIDAVKGKPLIYDMENVQKRADGTIVKEDRDDPAQQADALDTFRYFCNTFLNWFKPVV
ncbi:phage terminase large subunit [Danxiaibacter flavus]|uniref:Phage terminase large subunit n=1 Tax=Danxiaibacter flavus TaxID=3049108 RepID=A0ABV3ZI16_9BACT|nr:phage terminase large subunit [Chitinophagaceae bacterium DXS]